jgi:hypothetical protein
LPIVEKTALDPMSLPHDPERRTLVTRLIAAESTGLPQQAARTE